MTKTIERQAAALDWAEVDKYEFSGKQLLRAVIVDKATVSDLGKSDMLAFSDGTPVGQQTVRKYITRALARLAIAMLEKC